MNMLFQQFCLPKQHTLPGQAGQFLLYVKLYGDFDLVYIYKCFFLQFSEAIIRVSFI